MSMLTPTKKPLGIVIKESGKDLWHLPDGKFFSFGSARNAYLIRRLTSRSYIRSLAIVLSSNNTGNISELKSSLLNN